MAELEAAAVELGYLRVHLTTGPRQAEAKNLYLAGGYIPRLDQSADPDDRATGVRQGASSRSGPAGVAAPYLTGPAGHG